MSVNDKTLDIGALLPCPFCGGQAGILIETGVDYADCTVVCHDCSAETFARAPDKDETHAARDAAVAGWNRRTATKAAMMNEWKPIETAPDGIAVRLGYWDDITYNGKLMWKTETGVAFNTVSYLFGLINRRKRVAWDRYTHWMPLPEPPSATKGQADD